MNAEEAARAIGCSTKTVHRHLAKGTITARRKHSQELEITQEQVEILRAVLVESTKSGQSRDTSGQIESLPERVANLEQRIASLERHVETLQSIAGDAARGPVTASSSQTTTAVSTGPEIAATRARDTVPADWVLCKDFFKGHGISETTGRRWLDNGLEGATFDFEERGRFRYFTPAQQEKTIALLKRHGKLKETNE